MHLERTRQRHRSDLTLIHWGPPGNFQLEGGKSICLRHLNRRETRIGYSPSGKFVATGYEDQNVYVWEAPNPQTNVGFIFVAFTMNRKSFLIRQAQKIYPRIDFFLSELTAHPVTRTIVLVVPRFPLAGASRNDGMDRFWNSQPDREQRASLHPQRIFNKL
ncbi:hypothetical protein PAXINDRAFT_14772 [Paxillus involutus ATCC 200175]|uniref:Uncharacterized protein n=1 Tax=Paxillus involutus ATCC 200175 TaxID=664439 RepID=A0A0C9TPF8_PAXIN|nr:hypothetical protein PAXINDRAFT_14772 [Paxillus involutus ATCC 200175]